MTYSFRNRRGMQLPFSLNVGDVLAYFEVHTSQLFDVPWALC